MKPLHLERLTWVLLYGGILLLCLGLFTVGAAAQLGAGLIGIGALGIVCGIFCIFIRSRMSNERNER